MLNCGADEIEKNHYYKTEYDRFNNQASKMCNEMTLSRNKTCTTSKARNLGIIYCCKLFCTKKRIYL
jgi:hypothetical protein